VRSRLSKAGCCAAELPRLVRLSRSAACSASSRTQRWSENAIEEFIARFQAGTAAEEVTLSARPQCISVGERRLNYLDEGTGPAPIILLHGFGGNIDSWLLNRTALAEGHRVICVDRPVMAILTRKWMRARLRISQL